MSTKKSTSELIRIWVAPVIIVLGYVFGAGIFYQTVGAQEQKIKELKNKDTKLEKSINDLSGIQSSQHTIQSVQAAQMKWIMQFLKKNGE